ncbi:MAG: universal stress protein UspA [Novosphingobium sp.]
MKNVLLLVHDDSGQEARLQAALDIVRAIHGHLSCVNVTIIPMFSGDYAFGVADASLYDDERRREAANKVELERRLGLEGVSWDWVDATGSIAQEIIAASTLSDLIVLNRKLDSLPFPAARDVASRIITHVRVPILAVPDGLARLALDRALVAWDGHMSVANALRGSVPLLGLASEVEIFTIHDGSTQAEPAEAAAYLSRYGIHAVIREVDDRHHAADQLIAAECGRCAADYVVMGAYSRGRMMEAFGGVTRRMLASSTLPLILGH